MLIAVIIGGMITTMLMYGKNPPSIADVVPEVIPAVANKAETSIFNLGSNTKANANTKGNANANGTKSNNGNPIMNFINGTKTNNGARPNNGSRGNNGTKGNNGTRGNNLASTSFKVI